MLISWTCTAPTEHVVALTLGTTSETVPRHQLNYFLVQVQVMGLPKRQVLVRNNLACCACIKCIVAVYSHAAMQNKVHAERYKFVPNCKDSSAVH